MQSQCVMESEVNFTHLMTFRLSDINIPHRRVDGISWKFTLNNFYQNPVFSHLVLNPNKDSQHIHHVQRHTYNSFGICLCATILIPLQTLNGHIIRTLNNSSQFDIIPVLGSHTHIHNISVIHYSDTLFGFRFHNTNSLLQ